jgi:Xaa-Pro dipeptidase
MTWEPQGSFGLLERERDDMIGGSNASEQLAELKRWSDPAPAITMDERQARLEQARHHARSAGADALVVVAGTSLNYFLGISWRLSERLVALVIRQSRPPVLVAPQFEQGSLAAIVDAPIETRFWEEDESPFDLVADILRDDDVGFVAIDPTMPYTMASKLTNSAPGIRIMDASAVLDGCRMIKSSAELALLRQAKQMTLEVQRRAALILRTGIRSSEVVRFIDDAHRAIGSAGNSFCIVQFGTSTAFPHGLPKDDVLEDGDMVLIDTGCANRGYNSDITRSYVFGDASTEQRTVWAIEREAQLAAFEAVRPGVACEEIDNTARRVLEGYGFGPDYQLPGLPHRTGHGIGMALHEAPYLVRGDKTPLEPGMCFSIEPMIVVPHNFGIRLEDHFYVTDRGAEWFTQPSPSIEAPF